MPRYHMTADGPVAFTPEEELEWDAMEIAANALGPKIAAVLREIDADVDAIIGQVIGNRATEYSSAETDAIAYKLAGYTGTVKASIQDWADVKGWTAKEAADDILLQASIWRGAQAAIRKNRLQRKEQARVSTTQTQLDAASAGWKAFVTYIRGQLGV